MARNSSKRRAVFLSLAAGAITAAGLAGCAPTSSDQSSAPTASLQTTPGSSQPSVVLTQLGKQRIGVATAPVGTGPGGAATFPYSALLYESDGTTAVYVPTGQLTFLRHFVKVAEIKGNTVVASSGVTPGQSVVTAGAEELLGVQNGVGEED